MVSKREGEGVGWMGSRCKLLPLELIRMRSYYIAQGIISSLFREDMMEGNIRKEIHTHTHTHTHTYIHIYMYDWVTMLYSRNWHNTVNQLE